MEMRRCRRCRGILDCSEVGEFHKACKCILDLRRRVLTRTQLQGFLRTRCCTEAAANALLKEKTERVAKGLEELLSPACESCTFTTQTMGGWKRSKAFCNWDCCKSFSSPCLVSLLVLLRSYSNKLKIDQALELEQIILGSNEVMEKNMATEDIPMPEAGIDECGIRDNNIPTTDVAMESADEALPDPTDVAMEIAEEGAIAPPNSPDIAMESADEGVLIINPADVAMESADEGIIV